VTALAAWSQVSLKLTKTCKVPLVLFKLCQLYVCPYLLLFLVCLLLRGRLISPTTIRKMVETEIDDAAKRGQVSPFQQMQVHNVNGHSRTTMRTHYTVRDRSADGR
jgi:hypothetical protein